LIQG